MSVLASCTCGYSRNLDDFYAGKKIRCPSCEAAVFVPTLDVVYDIEDMPPLAETPRPVHPGAPGAVVRSHPGSVHNLGGGQSRRPDSYMPLPAGQRPAFGPAPEAGTISAGVPNAPAAQFNPVFAHGSASCGSAFGQPATVQARQSACTPACGGLHMGALIAMAAPVLALFVASKSWGLVAAAAALSFTSFYLCVQSARRRALLVPLLAVGMSVLAFFLSYAKRSARLQAVCPAATMQRRLSNSEQRLPPKPKKAIVAPVSPAEKQPPAGSPQKSY